MFMEFSLNKVSQVELMIEYKGDTLELSASNVTYKVAKVVLRDSFQFKIFNDFVRSTGRDKALFTLYKEMYGSLDPTNNYSDATMKKYINDILDIMDIKSVEQYLRDIGIKPPDSLVDEFDINDEKDMKKTRRQTYTKPEFYGLMAIVMISKALIPIRAITKDKYMVISLLTMMMDHPLFDTPQMMRLVDYIDAHINQAARTDDAKNRRVLNLGIAADDLTDYVLAIELFNKFPIALVTMNYPSSGNIVASIFKYATGVVTGQEKLTDAVKQKKTFKNDSGDDDSESVTEGYRQSTRLPIGELSIIKMVTGNIDRLANDIGVKDIELLNEINVALSRMRTPIYSINNGSVILMALITHKIIDSRSIESMYRDGLVNLLVVTITYLIENGYSHIAKYLAIEPKTSLDFSLSSINLKAPVKSELLERIEEKYPVKAITRLKNKEIVTYAIDATIDKVINYFEEDDYKFILPTKYTDSEDENVILPDNIKTLLVEYMLAF